MKICEDSEKKGRGRSGIRGKELTVRGEIRGGNGWRGQIRWTSRELDLTCI